MIHVRSTASLLVLVAAMLALTGCPKRPVTSVAQVPAPVAPAPAPAAPAPVPAPAPPTAVAPPAPVSLPPAQAMAMEPKTKPNSDANRP